MHQTCTLTTLSPSCLAQPGREMGETGGFKWKKVCGNCRICFQKADENMLGPRQQPWGIPFDLYHRLFLSRNHSICMNVSNVKSYHEVFGQCKLLISSDSSCMNHFIKVQWHSSLVAQHDPAAVLLP